ncbi:phage tail tape measure protein [Lactiplantibacillus plantarum]|uniref:phage tail tape measure protein n=1 Tax=Lactiplantibacillus plantarum TaxID=1590 RepID=UPI0030B5E87F
MVERLAGITYAINMEDHGMRFTMAEIRKEAQVMRTALAANFQTIKAGGDVAGAWTQKVKDAENAIKAEQLVIDGQRKAQKGLNTDTEEGRKAYLKYEKQIQSSERRIASLTKQQEQAKNMARRYRTGLEQTRKSLADMEKSSKAYVERLKAEGKEAQSQVAKYKALGNQYQKQSKLYQLQVDELKRVERASGNTSHEYHVQATRVEELRKKMAVASAEYNKLDRSVGGVSPQLARLSDKITKHNASLKTLAERAQNAGHQVMGASLVAGTGMAYGVKKAIELENQYRTTTNLIVTGGEKQSEATKNVAQMQKDASRYATHYGESLGNIANGYQDLVKRGYSSEQSLGAMKSMLQASKASGDDFNDVIKVSAQTLESFDMRANSTAGMTKNTKEVVNELAYAADATATDFQSLGKGMEYVGATAHNANISLSETSAAMGILSNNGLEADKAGTGLRKVIISLTAATDENSAAADKRKGKIQQQIEMLKLKASQEKAGSKQLARTNLKIQQLTQDLTTQQESTKGAAGAMQQLGLKSQDLVDKTGKLKPLSEIFGIINQKMKELKMPSAERNNLFNKLFGTTGQQAGIILSQNAKAIDDLNTKVKRSVSDDYVGKLSKKNMESAQNQIKIFKEQGEVLAVESAKNILPYITKLVKGMSGLIDRFEHLSDGKKKFVAFAVGTTAVLAPLLILIGKVAGGIRALNTGAGALIRTMGRSHKRNKLTDAVEDATNLMNGDSGGNGRAGARQTKTASKNLEKVDVALENVSRSSLQASKGSSKFHSAMSKLQTPLSASRSGIKTLATKVTGLGKHSTDMSTRVGRAGAQLGKKTGLFSKAIGGVSEAAVAGKGSLKLLSGGLSGFVKGVGGLVGKLVRSVPLVGTVIGGASALIGANKNNLGQKAGGAIGSMAGGTAGAAIGTAILPGIGTAVGGVAGSMLGEKFGSSWGKGANKSIAKIFTPHKVLDTTKLKGATGRYVDTFRKGISSISSDFLQLTNTNGKTATKLQRHIQDTYNALKKSATSYYHGQENTSKKNLDLLVKNGSLTRKQADAALQNDKKTYKSRLNTVKQSISDIGKITGKYNEKRYDIEKKYDEKLSKQTKSAAEQKKKILAQYAKKYGKNSKQYHDEELSLDKKASKNRQQVEKDKNRELDKLHKNYQEKVTSAEQKANAKVLENVRVSSGKQRDILNDLKNSKHRISTAAMTEAIHNSAKERDSQISDANKTYKKTKSAADKKRDDIVSAAEHEYYGTGSISKKKYEEIVGKANKEHDDTVSAAKDQRDKIVDHAKKTHNKVVDEATKQAGEHKSAVDTESGDVLSKWDKFVAGFAHAYNGVINFVDGIFKWMTGHTTSIHRWYPKGYARGVNGLSRDELAVVGEEGYELAYHPKQGIYPVGTKGQELTYLQAGTSILPHAQSKKFMSMVNQLPHHATGVMGTIQEAVGDATKWIKRTVGDVDKFVENGAEGAWKWLNKKLNLTSWSHNQVWKSMNEMATGTVKNTKDAFSKKFKKLFDDQEENIGSGPMKSLPQLEAIARHAAKIMKVNPSSQFIKALANVAMSESGGRAGVGNFWDSNAKKGLASVGLLQYIPTTWDYYAMPGHRNRKSILDNFVTFFNNSDWKDSIGYVTYANWGGVHKWDWKHTGPIGHRRMANGGIVDREQLIHMAEGNQPEAVIPMDPNKRGTALGLLAQVVNRFKGEQPQATNGAGHVDALTDKLDQLISLMADQPTVVQLLKVIADKQLKLDGSSFARGMEDYATTERQKRIQLSQLGGTVNARI